MMFFIVAMVLMFGLGMVLWLVLYTNYSRLLDDVRSCRYKTPLIKQIIRRYVDCKKLEIDVRNVNVFVEKSIVGYEVCGLAHGCLEKLAKSMEYLIVMLAVSSALFFMDRPDEVYMCMALGVLETLALHLCRKLADIGMTQRSVVIELVNYLENSGELPYIVLNEKKELDRLSGRAYLDFVKLNRCFNRIYEARSLSDKSLNGMPLNSATFFLKK